MPATCGAPRGPVLVERLSRSARYKTVDLRAHVRVSEPRTSIGVLASPARFELTTPGLGILPSEIANPLQSLTQQPAIS